MEYFNYNFGKGLSEIRKQKGFSTKEVYSGLCHRSMYRKIENGVVKNPSFMLVMSLCSRLGVTIDTLLKYSPPLTLEKYLKWLYFAEESFTKLKIETITSNLPHFDRDELAYLKNELPTPKYQKFVTLYFLGYFLSDNKLYSSEEIIAYFEEALYLTYRNESRLLTSTEVALVNNLLNLTNLSETYFQLALKFQELLLLDGHDINERSILLINNAIAFYYYYKKNWIMLFEHSTQFLKNYSTSVSFVLLHPIKYFVGLSMFRLGREEDGIRKIRSTLLGIKISNLDDEYKLIQKMIIDDGLRLSWFDRVDDQIIISDYKK